MKRALIAAAVLSLAFTVPAFAVEGVQPAKEVKESKDPKAGDTFTQRKAGILKRLDERMAAMQSEKKCVKAAKNPDELSKCREVRRGGDRRERREGMHKRGGPEGPAGQAPAQVR
jgi:hypothetical protein